MVIASRLPLAEYFRRPARPQSLTSTFPNYFTPFELSPLDDEASDALLLQPSEHPLTVKDAAEAKRWAKGHPCHLQVAGQAWYEARAEGHASKWAVQRFNELRRQSCMTGQAKTRRYPKPRWLGRGIGAIFWHVPLSIGRLAQRLGARVDDVAARIIGAVVILLLFLVLLGVVRSDDLVGVIKKGLGLE